MQRPLATPQAATLARPSIFQGAPTAKLIALATAVSFFVLRSQREHYHLLMAFDTKRLSRQPHRYWTSKLLFSSPSSGEFFTGTLLLFYWMRGLEREMGSRKFILFCVFINLLSMFTEYVLYHACFLTTSSWMYAGPYPLLGALFTWFHLYTPRMYPRFVQAFGFSFSEKSLPYALFFIVAYSQRTHSLLACSEGILGWFIYQYLDQKTNHVIDIPQPLVRFISPWAARFLEGPPPVVMAPLPSNRRANGPIRQAPLAPQQQPFIPIQADPAAVEQLMSMGFQRSQVIDALQQTQNNVERAADRLLTQATG